MKDIEIRHCAVCGKEIRRKRYKHPPEKTLCGDRSCVSAFGNSHRTLKTVEERFWSFVDKTSSLDGCWLWTGIVRDSGLPYGRFRPNHKRAIPAHRFSWQLIHGPVPDGLIVCHSCDNPRCVNPDHLWLGTHADNAHDRDEKGRQISRKGVKNGKYTKPEKTPWGEDARHKLTEDQVREIKVIGQAGQNSPGSIAKMYGVNRSTIDRILKGRSWKRLTD